MTREDIVAFCETMVWSLGANHRDGWVIAHCPLARWRHGGGRDRNPSFAISIGDDPPRCVCLACDYGGTLIDLLNMLVILLPRGTPERKMAVQMMQGVPVNKLKGDIMAVKTTTKTVTDPLFPEVWLKSFPEAVKGGSGLLYLIRRGVKASDVEAMDIRIDPGRDRVCFPIRDWSGTLRGMQGRATRDGEPKYLFYKYDGVACGHQVMLGENFINTEKPVILVEGAFDYAALFPYTRQVMVLWGARVTSSRLARLKRLTKIYTAFDMDEAGNNARVAMTGSGLSVTNLMIPEVAKGQDVGDLPEEALRNLAAYVDSYGKL